MTEPAVETPTLTEQEQIELKCQKLGKMCESLLGDYGTTQMLSPQTSFPRSLFHSISNTFNTDVTKLPTGKFRSIEKDVLIDGRITKVRIWNVEGQIQISEEDANGEALVIDESISWIQRKRQPTRDINDLDTKYVSPTRRVEQADVTKYEKIIDLTRNDLVRNTR